MILKTKNHVAQKTVAIIIKLKIKYYFLFVET